MNNLFKSLAVLCLTVLQMQCGKTMPQTAGGASGTEVSACVITGIVVDSLNNPISGSIVRLRPYDYIPGETTGVSSQSILDTSTGPDGRYSFDSVKAGQYLLEAVFSDTLGLVIEFAIESGDSMIILDPAILKPMAIVTGSLMPGQPGGPGSPLSVQAIGLERSAPIDSTGHFEMRVPPGWCRINMPGIGPGNPNIDTVVFLQPGQRLIWAPPLPPKPCDSLICDTMIVREILNANGLQALPAESVIVSANNHVTELHLRARNIHVLPATIGFLIRLAVLDIGGNFLDNLPPEIGHLHSLKTLQADNNVLWLIPATIGMLDSLRMLDLSFNRLQSLPEPITYLHPSAGLNLSNNMLCNIGEFTIEWLEKYEPDWPGTQLCQ
jgi:hypothetical protein